MPFRDERRAAPLDAASARFSALVAELDVGRGWFDDRAPLRLAALALVRAPGAVRDLAARTRTVADRLDAVHGPWTGACDDAVRVVLAAAFIEGGTSSAEHRSAIAGIHAALMAAGVRRGGAQAVFAAMVLLRTSGRACQFDVIRTRAIHTHGRGRGWPDGLVLPVCALLASRTGTPLQIAEHVEAIDRRLATAQTFATGDERRLAAGVLGSLACGADEAAARFVDLAREMRAHGVRLRRANAIDVATLAFVPRTAARVAEHVATTFRHVVRGLGWHERAAATNIAANLALVESQHRDDCPRLAALAAIARWHGLRSIVTPQQAALLDTVVIA